jgi:hypothetical protein
MFERGPRREGESSTNAEWECGDTGQQMKSDKHQHLLWTLDSNVQRWLKRALLPTLPSGAAFWDVRLECASE